MNEEVTLKPCPVPWCERQNPVWRMGASGRYVVSCECGIDGPWGDTRAEAIAAWNTRTISPTVPSDAEVAERIENLLVEAYERGFDGPHPRTAFCL